MTKINILEFHNYSEYDWLKFLRLQKTNVFDIAFPKIKREPFDDKTSILTEYRIAACIGQELDWICEDFMYSVPALDETGTFNFIAITSNFKELALVLCFIAEGFNEHGEASPEYLEYVDILLDCISEWNTIDEPCACRLLINICKQLENDASGE
ncbi:MAG TPA: hypothetical protein VNT20_15895 [Flavisolibacter sp.]|jgi:hypothetical protein|nr:hypothetical protein [Flavisolibacter sp.]